MKQLVIAGSGIKFLSHLTYEVQSAIQKSDCVLYLVNDPAMKKWITDHSQSATSLDHVYFAFEKREESYRAIFNEIVQSTIENQNTCFITYGHPMFLSSISLMLLNELKGSSHQINIEVLPGISSLDCLLCDLCIDPGDGGIQAYEAMEFITKNYQINIDSHFVLLQVGVVGNKQIITDQSQLTGDYAHKKALAEIKEKLLAYYTETHPIVLYVASMYPTIPFDRIDSTLSVLDKLDIPRLASLYIPPVKA